MAKRTLVTITVASRDNRELPLSSAIITRVDWDKQERMKNALKTFGFLFTLSFVSIFIPILHFVLVPSLFIGSFVFAMDKYQEKMRSEGGSGECPKCHQEFKVQPSSWVNRVTNNCDHCHEDLEMKIPV
jgi:hypothetical protein